MSKLPSSPSSFAPVAATIEIPVKCALQVAGIHMDAPCVVLRLSVEVIAIEDPVGINPQMDPNNKQDNPPSLRPVGRASLGADFAYDRDDFEKNWLDYSGECG